MHYARGDGGFQYSAFIRDQYSIIIGAAFWAPPEFYDWYSRYAHVYADCVYLLDGARLRAHVRVRVGAWDGAQVRMCEKVRMCKGAQVCMCEKVRMCKGAQVCMRDASVRVYGACTCSYVNNKHCVCVHAPCVCMCVCACAHVCIVCMCECVLAWLCACL